MPLQHVLVCLALVLPAALMSAAGEPEGDAPQPGRLRLTIVFDNVPNVDELETGWGYACVVQGLEKTILFDTGADGEILLSNMRKLGIDPADVDVVFLSHVHGDHTRGLGAFLAANPDVEVWMPSRFPDTFREEVRAAGARVRDVTDPTKLFEGAHTTGEMGDQFVEQALVLEARDGLALITGCAHPGIAEIVARALRQHERKIELIAGGFHLRSLAESDFGEVVRALEKNGVERVAPSHCTGDSAVAAFRRVWGDRFVEAGCGAAIDF